MKKTILLLAVILFGFLYGCEDKNNPNQKDPIGFTVQTISLEVTDIAVLPLNLSSYTLDEIEISIEDSSIAFLDGDYIFPLKVGKTTINAVVKKTQQSVSLELIVTPVFPKIIVAREYLPIYSKMNVSFNTQKDIEEYEISISDESILSIVDASTLLGLKLGTVTLTIKDKEDPQLKSSIIIEVLPITPVLITPRSLLQIDERTPLIIISDFETDLDAYNIKADQEGVVEISSDYIVTAKKEGTVTLTLTLKENSLVSTTYEIIVDKPSTEVLQNGEPGLGPLFLSTDDIYATVQAGEVIEVKIAGGLDNYNYRWYSSDMNVLAATDQGKVMGIREGRCTLTVASKFNKDISGRININVVGVPNVDYASRMVEIALHEASLNYVAGANKDNKYGDWFKYNNVDWCAIFVSWVGNQAGVGLDVAHKFALVSSGVTWYQNRDGYYDRGTRQPQPGDIIFFQNSTGPSHTGVVISSDEHFVYTVEGNTSNGVFKRTYNLQDTYILGYGVPKYPSFTK